MKALLSFLQRANERLAVAAGLLLLVSVTVTLFDMVAILSLAGVATIIAYRGWPVLSKTIETNATANTTLETPLWIPQSLWFAGWVWFALSALVLAVCVVVFVASGKSEEVQDVAGMRGEV